MPFFDRRDALGKWSRLPAVFGIALILYAMVLTYLGYTMSPTQ
jgi:type VI protein secretion system component VasF